MAKIPNDQLHEMDDIFGRLTRIDMNQIPRKFSDVIARTKKKCVQQLKPACVYQSVGINRIADDVVDLENGTVIRGLLPPILLKDSFEALFFVATLMDFQRMDFDLENIVDTYFLDAWCSAMIETAGIWLCRNIESSMSAKDLYVTVSWCPGQYQFPLENQKTIFNTLQPWELQVNLTESYMMKPVKSLSGMMGLSEQEDHRNLIACQFCDLMENCPSKRKENCFTVAKPY
jgi:5-methyltetrahydrofolate--homocysteine methyltransferase